MGTSVVAGTSIGNCTENPAVDLTETWDLMEKTTSEAGATEGDPTLETIGEKGTEKEEKALGRTIERSTEEEAVKRLPEQIEGEATEIQIIEDGNWEEDGKRNTSLNHTAL